MADSTVSSPRQGPADPSKEEKLDVESANTMLQKVQEGLTQVGNRVKGGVSKQEFIKDVWTCVHSSTDVKKCFLVCEKATAACTCAADAAAAAEEAALGEASDSDDAAAQGEESEAEPDKGGGEEGDEKAELHEPPADFVETPGFVPPTVPSDIAETYPLRYMICGPSLFPQDPDCSCGGKYEGTEWKVVPPKPCPQCEGKKICLKCNGAGLKASKKACTDCSKKPGKCPTCSGSKFVKCKAKGCEKGNLTRPRKCELCGGRGKMMVWDGNMAFFYDQRAYVSEKIKFRGLTIEPKVWGDIAGKCESSHGCFYGLNSAFKGEYKPDPTGNYPLGIMEIVVDTEKHCGNGTRFVKFLGKIKKSGTDTFKWDKSGSLYGDDERTGYFKDGWIELFQSWAPCEMCCNSKTPGFNGIEELDCPECEGRKKPCPKCKKLPGKCLKCKGKGEIPTSHDCKACDDGNCPACAGVGMTPEKKYKVKARCPICGDSGKTGAKHALVPKFERLFTRRPWKPPAEEQYRLYFSERGTFYGVKHSDPDAYLGNSAALHLKEGKTLRCKIVPEVVVEWMDMGRGMKMKFESFKYWCEPEVGNRVDGRYFHNPERRILNVYFGKDEDNLGEPVTYWGDILDVELWETEPTSEGSAKRGYPLKPNALCGFGWDKQITYIDALPKVAEWEEMKRRVCELRCDFDGSIYLGAGDYKMADIPIHPTKLRSVWTGTSDRGYGEATCLLFHGFESEDCSGTPLELKDIHARSDPKGETNRAGQHWLWDQKIKSFRIFPKEGCDDKTFWGKDVPRWPVPPPLSIMPEEHNLDGFCWRMLHGCTPTRKEFVNDEGEDDFVFEKWQERWRRIWKDEACHLYGMTVDFRMVPPPPPPPEPEPLVIDFNGKWLVKYKAYYGVKDHIVVQNNQYIHKKKRYTVDTEKLLIMCPGNHKQTVCLDDSTEDFIMWRHWGPYGYITWERED